MTLSYAIDPIVNSACGESIRTSICARDGWDRQLNVLALARASNVDPDDLTRRLVTELTRFSDVFSAVEAAGNGFINLRLTDKQIIAHALRPAGRTDAPKRIMIDFGGPNIAKTLHVGHLRSLVIGESLRRILKERGHHVTSDMHYGDWGLPMGMLVAGLMRNDTATSNMSLEQLYPLLVQQCRDDPERMAEAKQITVALQKGEHSFVWGEIRRVSLLQINPQIERLGAHFDFLNGESHANEAIPRVLAMSSHREDQGATIIDVAEPGDAKTLPPIIFQKDDGGYTYAATDLATILQRADAGMERIIYVVDRRQSMHLEQVFRAARQFYPGQLDHVAFGTVNGADGKPYKTRDGDVPTLASMLDAAVEKVMERTRDGETAEIIAIGAIKFADLITNVESGYVFDLDHMLSPTGKTGPYLQYAAVRINSMMEMAGYQIGHSPDDTSMLDDLLPLSLQEHELVAACANFAEIMVQAETQLSPKVIAEYAYTVASKFSQFYACCQVVATIGGSLTKESMCRLAICEITYVVLSRCLYMLGIEIPASM